MTSQLTHGRACLRLALLAALAAVWLVPFFWVGKMGRLPVRVPPRLLHQYACAGLFTKRTWRWNQPIVQVRRGSLEKWETIDAAVVSPLGVYGYRQRLDRLLLKTAGTKAGDVVRKRAASWVAIRCQEASPEKGSVTAVRFGQNVWNVSCPELASPAQRWMPYPDDLGDNGRFELLAAFAIREGAAVPMPPREKAGPMVTPAVFARRAAGAARPDAVSAGAKSGQPAAVHD